MHPERIGSGNENCGIDRIDAISGVLLVDAETAFHGNRNSHHPCMAATHSPTRSDVRMRQAPNVPNCTRSDGQPTLRFISS